MFFFFNAAQLTIMGSFQLNPLDTWSVNNDCLAAKRALSQKSFGVGFYSSWIVLNQSPDTGFWSLDLLDLGFFRGPSSPLACRCCTSCSFPSVGIRQIVKDQAQTTSRIQTAKKKINPHTQRYMMVYVYTDIHTYIPMLAKEPHQKRNPCLCFVRIAATQS